MRTVTLLLAFGPLATLAPLVACGGAPVPVDRMAHSEASIRAAQEVGAPDDPKAALHLRLAQEQWAQADALIKGGGDNHRAEMLLRRAEADAELAVALAKERKTHEEAERLLEQLQVLKKKSM